VVAGTKGSHAAAPLASLTVLLLRLRKVEGLPICNLYTIRKSAAEVAAHFGVSDPGRSNAPEEVYPGCPGVVVREAEGVRVMQSMAWGFPLRLKGMSLTAKPKPVNNIADLAKPMWKGLAAKPRWRCLIPVTHFAEAEGPKGAKTRTWFNVKDQPIFAWAGLWRISDEWGPVYSGVMTDCNEAIRPIHDRMPVLLHADEHDRWLHGSSEDAISFQERCFPDELIEMQRTAEYWVKRKAVAPADAAPSLL
jgi:putative SOS response-associated peptidase YedK